MTPFQFQKSIQMLTFFCEEEGGVMNKMKALKLVWATERLHLRKHGSLIINDDFYAMKFGPVPSFTKDMVEGGFSLSEEEIEYRSLNIQASNNLEFRQVGQFEPNIFSRNALRSMEEVMSKFQKYDQFQLRDITHLYPEWSKFAHLFPQYASRKDMDVLDFFDNPVQEHFDIFKQDSEHLSFMKEFFMEREQLSKAVYSL